MGNYSEITIQAIEYINEHLSADLAVSDISSRIFTSRSNLQKIFKEDTGVSVGRYIDLRIIEKAKEYLEYKDMTINEISRELGFCDRCYFSRKFFSVYKMTPHKYRCAAR